MPTESDFKFEAPQITYGSNNRTLLGFYVQQASSTVSWGDNGSSLNLTLVKENDDFNYLYNDFPATVGHPIRFKIGGFYFGGILSKVTKKKATSGLTYDIVVVDPREILQATSVIIGQYSGTVPVGVGNIINAYGFWEDPGIGGFGWSGSDNLGMPWTSFFSAVLQICNKPIITPYGGPMRWGLPTPEFPNGVYYSLDLSELPIPDPYYRIEGNGVVSLYDVINKVCQDAGYDFVVELIGYTIKIRVINRKFAPALGTIGAIVNTPGSNATAIEHGIEMAQGHQTAAMLIGAPKEGMFAKANFTSFWGYDHQKNPILGHPGTIVLAPKIPGESPIYYRCEMMNLYAFNVEDVIGSQYYFCSTLELQFAMAGIDSWMEFIEKYRPDVFFAMTGFVSNRTDQIRLNGLHSSDYVQTDPKAILARALEATYDRSESRRRFFSWLSGVAQQHLGKEFMVSLGPITTDIGNLWPSFFESTVDPEQPFDQNLRPNIRYEFDVCRSAYMPIEEAFLYYGLKPISASTFMDDGNRFEPIALYNYVRLNQTNAFIENPQETVFDTYGVYTKVTMGDQIEEMALPNFVTPYSSSPFINYILDGPGFTFIGGPLVRATVQNPIFSRTTDPSGDHSVISRVLGTPATLYQTNAESSKTRMYPPPVNPSFFILPLKSNRYCYGPFWTYSEIPGRVKIEVDSDLTPASYGSEILMNRIAIARLFDGSSQLALTEHGRVTIPDFPQVSIGQALQVNGPAVTSVEVSFGTGGVQTTYAFQNFSPRFGVIPRQTQDRLRKVGQLGSQLRRNLFKLAIESQKTSQGMARAAVGAMGLQMTAGAFDKFHRVQTPHECIAGFAIPALVNSNRFRLDVKTAPLHELMSNTQANDPESFANKAIASQDTLFRPFRVPVFRGGIQKTEYGITYKTLPEETSLLPKAEFPYDNQLLLTNNSASHMPFIYPRESDISIVTYQKANGEPCEINNWDLGAGDGAFEARSIGLRGPVMVVGYGQDLYNPGLMAPSFQHKVETKSHKAGPVDLFWDDIRKVWSGTGVTRVQINIAGNPAIGQVILGVKPIQKNIEVYSPEGLSIRQGTTLAVYVPNEQKWYQVSAGGGNKIHVISSSQAIPAQRSINMLLNSKMVVVNNVLSTPVSSGATMIISEYGDSYIVIAADC